MALSSLTPSSMLGELGRLASWLRGDCGSAEEFAGLAVTEKVSFLPYRVFNLLQKEEFLNSVDNFVF